MTNIGENLILARKRALLSQAQLGELMSRGTRSIIHYEKGERSAPFEVIERWAEVTGVTVEELRTGNKPEIPEGGKEEMSVIDSLTDKIVDLKFELRELKQIKSSPTRIKTDEALALDLSEFALELNEADLVVDSLFASRDYAMMWAVDLKLKDVNKKFTEVFGYTADELQGKMTSETPLVRNGAIAIMNQHIADNKPFDVYHLELTAKNGSQVPVRIQATRGTNSRGQKVALAKLDITNQPWRSWAGFHGWEELSVTTPEDYQLIHIMNPSVMTEHYGWTAADQVDLVSLLKEEDVPEAMRLRQSNLENIVKNNVVSQTVSREHSVRHKDGHYILSEFRIVVSYDPDREHPIRSKVYFHPKN